ncbi:hypothetical protein [uncultured Helicobacter sp.]|nr:hypothetical protein [uncultured Helicobacter sp.]
MACLCDYVCVIWDLRESLGNDDRGESAPRDCRARKAQNLGFV